MALGGGSAPPGRPQFPCRICVVCGTEQEPGTSSVIWYSDTSVSLATCKTCWEHLDPFVELEFQLIALDLMLHRVMAFRHVLCNRTYNLSIWMRFAIVINVIEVLAHFWVARRDPTFEEIFYDLAETTVIFGLSMLCFCSSVSLMSRENNTWEHWSTRMRAFILSRFPSLLFVIAMAWWFPGDFYPVIALYSFSTSVAAARALPEVDTIWMAIFVAVCGAVPRLARLAESESFLNALKTVREWPLK